MNDLPLLTRSPRSARHSLTSIPWPANREDLPAVQGVAHQIVPLLESALPPRLRRFLLLTQSDHDLPTEMQISPGEAQKSGEYFSRVEMRTLHEALDTKQYTYRECEARIHVAGREIALRMGLRPNDSEDQYSWWQWCRAERVWSGPVAEAWRIGGHLVPYTIDTPGKWDRPELTDLGDLLQRYCGDILHGDIFAIIWRDGLIQCTAHFKSAYFHTFPKPVPAFPVIFVDGKITEPWDDLRFLASKDKEDRLHYLPPGEKNVLPAGVSRTYRFNIGEGEVARYRVPPQWYRACCEIESDQIGPAAQLAARNAQVIRECTEKTGIDAGRVWRYLMRSKKQNLKQEDGAEWEGNLAQAMFTLAYQLGESPDEHWPIYLDHAYHAADVSVYHGAWMGRLECTAAFTAPLPKFRFGGFVYAYLETGDPYLLELARSVAGVYMAMEWALQPRSAIGRDAYPLTCLMSLWDFTADPLYLDFAKQTALRLLSTQESDGGFAAQAGAGVLTGVSAKTALRSIHFGSGILAPFALLEWAIRDRRWPEDFVPRIRKWAELMLQLQKPDGHWYVDGRSDEPYTLTGSATVFTLIKAGEILREPRCFDAVRRYLSAMNEKQAVVLGTHAFLSAQYAHIADAKLG